MASVDNNHQAKVEDCSDSDTPITRKSSPQANVSTKWSKDLNSDQGPIMEKVPTNIDGRSDSGYSSYTAASKSSADSAPRTQPPPPPVAAPVVLQSPAPKSRRSVGGESRQHSNESSPRQKPSRTASISSKSRSAGQRRPTATQGGAEERKVSLGDPNWITCGPNAARELPHRNRRPEMPPSMSSHNVRETYPSDQLSQHSDPNPYSPPSPTYTRQPAPYSAQGPTIVQTARTRRPSVARQRPQSFAGDPSVLYGMSGMPAPYPSPPQEHQQHARGPPPPAFYNNMQHMPNMQYTGVPPYGMHPVQQPGYPYPPQHQTSPPYDGRPQRPDMSARGSSGYGPRSYPGPISTPDGNNEPPQYSARYSRQPPTPVEPQHQVQQRLSQMPPPKLLQYGDESSEEESEEEEYEPVYEEHEARQEQRRSRALMPPPKLTRAQSQRRPALPHAKTAPAVEQVQRRESRRRSIVLNDPTPARERPREPRVPTQRTTTDPSRRASVSRPPIHRQTQSEYVTPQARIEVNHSRSNRRQSYQAYERAQQEHAREQARALEERYKEEQKRQKRASKVYIEQERRHMPGRFQNESEEDEDEEDDDDESAQEEPPPALRTRRRADTEERPRRKRAPEPKGVDAAEEYIMSTRGSYEPYADSINKAARRGSRMPASFSESGSSHSSGRASQSNRTTMTSNTNGEVRLRLESGQAINLQLSGEMEGRTLQLLPAENGMTDLVIGNARGEESVYHSEKSSMRGGSNPNRRSTISSRRDAEVITESRSRNGRTRRERDEILDRHDDRDHVLRRTHRTNYH